MYKMHTLFFFLPFMLLTWPTIVTELDLFFFWGTIALTSCLWHLNIKYCFGRKGTVWFCSVVQCLLWRGGKFGEVLGEIFLSEGEEEFLSPNTRAPVSQLTGFHYFPVCRPQFQNDLVRFWKVQLIIITHDFSQPAALFTNTILILAVWKINK